MTALRTTERRWPHAIARLAQTFALLFVALCATPAFAQSKVELFASKQDGFARIILNFAGRLDMPKYELRYENNVLAVVFDEPIEASLPDVGLILADYVSIARVDPDKRGIRFGLRTKLNVNKLEAGEQLYLDLLPMTWQGLPPGLPPEVVANLAERAKHAAELAAIQSKAQRAKDLKPKAKLRVGRTPTFVRLEFEWTVPTEAKFVLDGSKGDLLFDWPVPIDLYAFKVDMPPEVMTAENDVGPEGSHVRLKLADGVVPRFYTESDTRFTIDIDTAAPAAIISSPNAAAAARIERQIANGGAAAPADQGEGEGEGTIRHQAAIQPTVQQNGSTVRINFPFDNETPAAVFRRGDTVWMMFDTTTVIEPPPPSDALNLVAHDLSVVPAGDTQVVRLNLAGERLATLGSEGRAWVLSLGDMLLTPTEPITLNRRLDDMGQYEVIADLARPGRVHQFRDPVVGDVLSVVTALPPARGITRGLEYVDFDAIRSVHGLVVRPEHDDVTVTLDQSLAVIKADGGLIVSAVDRAHPLDAKANQEARASYIDFAALTAPDTVAYGERLDVLQDAASRTEGAVRDKARLDLARYYLANQFAHEAIGVARVLSEDLKADDLKKPMRLTLAIANTLADRPREALSILGAGAFSDEADALMWRAIARTQAADFNGARIDAQSAESVVDGYPAWIRSKFLLSATRAAVEMHDAATANRFLSKVEFSTLTVEDASLYQLLTGRIAEELGHDNEALDTYGQVIAADIRPTRAEAVFRTLKILNQQGRIDLAKATQTLAAESLMWRGNALESDMQRLLAELYFRNRDYRLGFETVKQAVAYYPDSAPSTAMVDQAQQIFGDLYLNGKADALSPVDALSLYYDYRSLTPPGARGDEMIRNLARRLVKVDLLTQASDLLRYQIENRLKGVAQSQVAADLAVIEIADRRPQEALTILNKTRLPDLSPSLERQRRVLEARALIDAGRYDLAIDFLSRLSGRDVDLLRIDAHWAAKRYGDAAELIEVLYASDREEGTLSQPARMNIIKAATGFVMANDMLGLSRLREKYSARMAQSAEWPMFDFVTGRVTPNSLEFKQVATAIASVDSINAFLASYKDYYSGLGALTPATATRKEDAV